MSSGKIAGGLIVLAALGIGVYVGTSLSHHGDGSTSQETSAAVKTTAHTSDRHAGSASNATQKNVSSAPPAPVTNLHIDSVGPAQVSLSWNSSGGDGRLQYDVYRQAGPHTEKIGVTEKTSFSDTAVSPNQIYRYYIISKNSGGAQPPRQSATVGTPYTWGQIHQLEENDVVKIKTYTSIFGALGGGSVVGSGFFLPGGYIATSWHVIKDEHYVIDVYPYMNGNNSNNHLWYHAKTVHVDKADDIAVLKITGKGSRNSTWPPQVPGSAAIGQSVQNGEPVGVLGHLGGEALTMTSGHVTHTNMKYAGVKGIGTLHNTIAMKTPAVGGNSGSPVFNQYGNVVGILESGGVSNGDLSYAVPSAVLKQWGFKQTRVGVNFVSSVSGKKFSYWKTRLEG